MTTYLPGSFFLARISGATGYLIQLAQALAGDASRWTHAGIVISADGDVVEAEPGGARLANLTEYKGRPLLVSDTPVQQAMKDWDGGKQSWSETALRQEIVRQAYGVVGIPYSFADYLALAALHLHLPSRWIRNRVQSSGHLICSQLVDAVYERAGIHLYDDGRLPGDVAPADLAAWIEDHR